jgi:hypothetical protein
MICKTIAALMVVALCLSPEAANATKTWIKAESPHFIVYSDTDRKTTEAYVLRLEQYRYAINLFYAQPTAEDGQLPKFKMYFLENRKDMQQVWPKVPDYVAGFYTSCVEDQAAFAIDFDDRIVEKKKITDQPENMSQVVIFHEYAHHFMFENADQLYPPWFVEGFADYYGGSRLQGDTIAVGVPAMGRSYTLQMNRKLNYEDVLRSAPGLLTRDKVDLFYAQSWLLTHWFMATSERQTQLAAYIEAYNHREDPVVSFERITGIRVKELPKVLSKYMDTMQVEVFRVKDMPAPAITVSDMPASARDMLLPDASVRVCMQRGDMEGNTPFIQAAHETAEHWPDDDYANRVLARIDIVAGDESKAAPWLKTYVKLHPDDAEAVAMLGETYTLMTLHDKLAEGETKTSQMKYARELLMRAYKLDPLRAATLYYLSRAQQDLPDYPNETAVNAATQAHILVPAVSEYAVTAADLLVRKDRLGEARDMLMPLSNNPHGGNWTAWTNNIITAIDAGKPKAEIIKLFETPVWPKAPETGTNSK